MKITVVLLVLFGALVAALIAFVPATMIDRRLAAMSEGRLRLADAQGTVWQGRGALADVTGTFRIPVAWRVSPAAVARGSYVVVLEPVDGGATPRGAVALVDNGVRVRDLEVDLPAAALRSVVPARAAVPVLGGTLTVTSTAFAWGATGASGALSLRWRGARLVSGDAVVDLGTVDLAAAPTGDGLTGRLANTGGDARIEGTVALSATSASIDATIAPSPDAPQALTRVLASLGPPDPAGRVRVAWRGSLR